MCLVGVLKSETQKLLCPHTIVLTPLSSGKFAGLFRSRHLAPGPGSLGDTYSLANRA